MRMTLLIGRLEEAEDKERQMKIAKTIGDQLGGVGRVCIYGLDDRSYR